MGEGGLMRGMCGGAQFAMDFVMVGVMDEGFEQRVCRLD